MSDVIMNYSWEKLLPTLMIKFEVSTGDSSKVQVDSYLK